MSDDKLLARTHVFERGDRVFITTPLTLSTPSEQQVEEFAFASAVKTMAPNEHLGWLQGRYCEGNTPNRNGQLWLSDELAMKSMTPMLMPVTVMHDPRTAVGTIADVKLIDEDRARLETILAVWKHRFPEVWEEAASNIEHGELAQSMECKAPWYSCSDCGRSWVKLGGGAERASWCDHLRSNSSCRILGDVCFTGTGLIFGTRGGLPAYSEAALDHFQDEIAEFHDRAHIDGRYKPREEPKVGLVQIEDTELAQLRKERDDNKAAAEESAQKVRDLTTQAETAEANAGKEKERAEAAEKDRDTLKETNERAELRSKRWDALGTGFVAKLGEVTKSNLQESASTLSDEDWSARLAEVEELTDTKRDAKGGEETASTGGGSGGGGESASNGSSFSDEELATFASKGVTAPSAPAAGSTAARSLARALRPQRPKAEATK